MRYIFIFICTTLQAIYIILVKIKVVMYLLWRYVFVHGQTCVWVDHVWGHVISEHVAEFLRDLCRIVDSYRTDR